MKASKNFNWILIIGLLVTTACKKNVVPVATIPTTTVQVASTAKLGNVMTDSLGMSLYFFSADATGASACTGGCATTWPAFYKANLNLPSGLTASDFGTITRGDGQKQTTYKNWPMYYYSGDKVAGDMNGDQVGGIWYISKPDYSIMLARTQLVGRNGISYDSTLAPGTGNTVYFVDAWGKTLYAYAPDHFNKNNYTKSDFSNDPTWPIYQTSNSGGSVPSVFNSTDFGVTTVFTKTQLSYKGWPLYYFGPDSSIRGYTKGVSVPSPGVWPIIKRSTAPAPL